MTAVVTVFGLALVVFLIILREVPGLLRAGDLKGLAVFSALLVLGTVLSFRWALGLPLPNPTPLITDIVRWPWVGR